MTYHPDTGQAVMSIPTDLPALRAIDPDQVSVVVFLDGRRVENVNKVNQNEWSVTMDVAQQKQYLVRVEWIEQFNQLPLELGKAEEKVSITGADPVSLVFSNDSIDVSFDKDGDEWFNLLERSSDPVTDPRNINDPPARPDKLDVNVFFDLPDAIKNLELESQTTILSFLDSGAALPVREDTLLKINRVVPLSGPVFVKIQLVWSLGRDIWLARVAKTMDIPADRNIRLTSDDFRIDYDADSDGRSNLNEIAAGTNPRVPDP